MEKKNAIADAFCAVIWQKTPWIDSSFEQIGACKPAVEPKTTDE